MSNNTTVAVIGLGKMGLPIARNVADSGFAVAVWNRSEVNDGLLPDDVVVASTFESAVSEADIVVNVLSTADAFGTVFLDRVATSSVFKTGAVVVDLSTVSPGDARDAAERLDAVGVGYVDSPMSGSTLAATERQLIFMVGGATADVDVVFPLLEVLGRQVVHVGPLGAGMATKLVVNSVVHSLTAALAEAVELAAKSNLDLGLTYDVLQAGAVGAPLTTYKRPQFVDNDQTVAFSIDLMAKDLRLIADQAGSTGTTMPLSRAAADLARKAQLANLGQSDMAAVRHVLT